MEYDEEFVMLRDAWEQFKYEMYIELFNTALLYVEAYRSLRKSIDRIFKKIFGLVYAKKEKHQLVLCLSFVCNPQIRPNKLPWYTTGFK